MPFNANGISDGARPSVPRDAQYVAPDIIARKLNVYDKYDADPLPGRVVLPLALHHIVPWEHLWKFWNAMMTAEFYDAASEFLVTLRIATSGAAADVASMKAGQFSDPLDYHDAICWAPWNLVRGPRWRTRAGTPGGDPGPFVDDMSGGARQHADRIKSIAELDIVITTYTAKMHREDQLLREIRSWKLLAAEARLVEFDQGMWVIDRGRDSPNYTPSINHSVPIHPNWKKLI